MSEDEVVLERDVLLALATLTCEHDLAPEALLGLLMQQLRRVLAVHRAAVIQVDADIDGDGGRLVRHTCTCARPDPHEQCAPGDLALVAAFLAGTAAAPAGPVLVVPLRDSGRTLGVLLLACGAARCGERREALIGAVAAHLARAMGRAEVLAERAFADRSSWAIRRLLEEGTHATTVREAGEVLARATARAFAADCAGVYVVDGDGLIAEVVGVGIPAALSRRLESSLLGKRPPTRRSGAVPRPPSGPCSSTTPRRCRSAPAASCRRWGSSPTSRSRCCRRTGPSAS